MIKLRSTTKIRTTAVSIAATHELEGKNCSDPHNKKPRPSRAALMVSFDGDRELNCKAMYEDPINTSDNAPAWR